MFNLLNNKIWIYFVKNPLEKIHIRELSRQLKISPATTLKYAEYLFKKGLIKREIIGKNYVLSLNFDNKLFFIYKKFTNLFLLYESNLIEDIIKKDIKIIILFGSYSLGEDTEKSDIDIAIDKKININLEKYEKFLNKKIQLHFIEDIKKSKNMNLLDNIKQGILIEGFFP
ncbi:MAG: nucleotidyltransferase domain-containing protein [Candidatus Woesearchaeota archaeon]